MELLYPLDAAGNVVARNFNKGVKQLEHLIQNDKPGSLAVMDSINC